MDAEPNETGARSRSEYIELVKNAILFLNDPNGSPIKAITEQITANPNHWVKGVGNPRKGRNQILPLSC